MHRRFPEPRRPLDKRIVMDLRAQLKPVIAAASEHAERVDAEGVFPAEAVTALRESGLLGLVLPTDVGGLGAGPVEFTEVVGEIAAVCGSTAMIYLMHVSAAVTAATGVSRSPRIGADWSGAETSSQIARCAFDADRDRLRAAPAWRGRPDTSCRGRMTGRRGRAPASRPRRSANLPDRAAGTAARPRAKGARLGTPSATSPKVRRAGPSNYRPSGARLIVAAPSDSGQFPSAMVCIPSRYPTSHGLIRSGSVTISSRIRQS